ncbi:hypothetical protein FALCPG4_010823 [Fusarium falciforme]
MCVDCRELMLFRSSQPLEPQLDVFGFQGRLADLLTRPAIWCLWWASGRVPLTLGGGFLSQRRRPGRQGAPVAGRGQSGRLGTWQGWEARVAFLPLAQATFENGGGAWRLYRRVCVGVGASPALVVDPAGPQLKPRKSWEDVQVQHKETERAMIQGRGQGYGDGVKARRERRDMAPPIHTTHTTQLISSTGSRPRPLFTLLMAVSLLFRF